MTSNSGRKEGAKNQNQSIVAFGGKWALLVVGLQFYLIMTSPSTYIWGRRCRGVLETSNSVISYHPTKFKIQINVRNKPTYFCWMACTFYDVASELVRLTHQEERKMNHIQMGNLVGGNNSAPFFPTQ